MPNVPAPVGAASFPSGPVHTGTVTCAASPTEEQRARRWLDDVTGGCIEHELDVNEVIAAVNALHEGGWPAFLADTTGYFRVLALLDGDDAEDDTPLAGGPVEVGDTTPDRDLADRLGLTDEFGSEVQQCGMTDATRAPGAASPVSDSPEGLRIDPFDPAACSGPQTCMLCGLKSDAWCFDADYEPVCMDVDACSARQRAAGITADDEDGDE